MTEKKIHQASDLEIFQDEDRKYCENLRIKTLFNEKKKLKQERIEKSNLQFDTEFVPFLNSISLSFESFCILLIRGYSGRCGSCAMYRDKRFQSVKTAEEAQDPLSDFCPHLVCTEWAFVVKMRSIGVVFWQRFLQTRPGRHFVLSMPQCRSCYWTDLYNDGSAQKYHLPLAKLKFPINVICDDKFTPKCFCKSQLAEKTLRQWCKASGLDGNRVKLKYCYCGRY